MWASSSGLWPAAPSYGEVQIFGILHHQRPQLDVHRQTVESRAISASAKTAALLCNLQISNPLHQRVFFTSLVSSQLFGMEQVPFDQASFLHLQTRFFKRCWLLPKSFPDAVCFFFLCVPPLPWLQCRRFFSFANRVGNKGSGTLNPSSWAFIWDRVYAASSMSSWHFSFWCTVHPFISMLSFCDLDVFSPNSELSDEILRKCRESHLHLFDPPSKFDFIPRLISSAYASKNFSTRLGALPFEESRLIVLFFGNSLRWSILRRPSRWCPLCSFSFSSSHFFSCNHSDLPQSSLTWEGLLAIGSCGDWDSFFWEIINRINEWRLSGVRFTSSVIETLRLFEVKSKP